MWETFVVRIWRERMNDMWRGQIVHLSSRESSYFISLAQAEVFIGRFAQGFDTQAGSPKGESADEVDRP
jgi:hypothetical protein